LAYRNPKATIMPLLRLLQGSYHDAREIGIMTVAHQEALLLCGITDRTSPAAEAIAKRVISKFIDGERDSGVIARAAAVEFKRSG
jgi:hypothetical protein